MRTIDFSIKAIELTTDQIESLYTRIVTAIDKNGIETFKHKTEIELSEIGHIETIQLGIGYIQYLINDLIKIWFEMEIYTEYKTYNVRFDEPPEPEEILFRSVMKLKIQLINSDGYEIDCNQMDEVYEKVKTYIGI